MVTNTPASERYRQTAADIAYGALLERIREHLGDDDLVFELDRIVGERLVETHERGYLLAGRTLAAVGYRAADDVDHGWRFGVVE